MSTVNAPKPSVLDSIQLLSVINAQIGSDGYLRFYNRDEDPVGSFLVRLPDSSKIKSVMSISSFDSDARDVLIKDWSPNNAAVNKIADPSVMPGGGSYGAAWSGDGLYLAITTSASPYVLIYKRSGDTLTKLANPATLPAGPSISVSWSPNSQYLVVTHLNAPLITIYKRSGDTLTKLSNPGFLLSGTLGVSSNWSPDGKYLCFSLTDTPTSASYRVLYSRTGDVFSKVDYDQTNGASQFWWSPDGTLVAILAYEFSSATLNIYRQEGDAFQLVTGLTPSPDADVSDVAWSYDSQTLLVTSSGATKVRLYKRNGTVFTAIPDGMVAQPSAASVCDWSPDGRYFALSTVSSAQVYRFKGDSTELAGDFAVAPGASVNGLSWSPDGRYLATASQNTPYLSVYKSAMGPIAGAAVRLID